MDEVYKQIVAIYGLPNKKLSDYPSYRINKNMDINEQTKALRARLEGLDATIKQAQNEKKEIKAKIKGWEKVAKVTETLLSPVQEERPA